MESKNYKIIKLSDEVMTNAFKQYLFDILLSHLSEHNVAYLPYRYVKKSIATPFYHNLQINKLKVPVKVEISPGLTQVLSCWKIYQSNKVNKFRALSVNVLQKIQDPEEVVIR